MSHLHPIQVNSHQGNVSILRVVSGNALGPSGDDDLDQAGHRRMQDFYFCRMDDPMSP